MRSQPEPLRGVVLTADALGALECAAGHCGGRPIGTTDLLFGILVTDGSGAWDAVQLQGRYLGRHDPAQFADPQPDRFGTWNGFPLTGTASDALGAAVRIAADYDMVPVPPGVLALGILGNPAAGAARAMLDGTQLDHAALLGLVQDEVLGVTLEDLDPVARPGGSGVVKRALRIAFRGQAPGVPDAVRHTHWAARQPGALDVLTDAVDRARSDPDVSRRLEAMLLDADSLRTLGRNVTDLEDEPADAVRDRARRRFHTDSPDPSAMIVAAAAGNSPLVVEVLRRRGLSTAELAAVFAELRLRDAGDNPATTQVHIATLANALITLLTTGLVVRAGLQGGHWWKLVFVGIVWSGYPGTGPFASAAVAGFLALVVAPLAGLVHLLGIAVELGQAAAERRRTLERTGVRLSLTEQRRVVQRLVSRPRMLRVPRASQITRAAFSAVRDGREDFVL